MMGRTFYQEGRGRLIGNDGSVSLWKGNLKKASKEKKQGLYYFPKNDFQVYFSSPLVVA